MITFENDPKFVFTGDQEEFLSERKPPLEFAVYEQPAIRCFSVAILAIARAPDLDFQAAREFLDRDTLCADSGLSICH
jgi:hypothetical protein